MTSLDHLYLDYINFPLESRTVDIHEHLPTLRSYAKECDHITEMGVRWGASTIAFLAARPQKMISYDIIKTGEMEKVRALAQHEKISHSFKVENVLTSQIEETDLLFIDTLHSYPQLLCELLMHSPKVKKYIILHDTESFRHHDEGRRTGLLKKGLLPALDYFLSSELWLIKERFTNNNGLTVLQRKL